MAIVRWEPFRDLSDLNRLFDAGGAQRRWLPAMDLVETTDEFVLIADLPGSPRRTSRSSSRTACWRSRVSAGAAHQDGYRRVERPSGAFSRSLTLPEGVDGEAITASFDRGVLEIRVPKPEARKPRRIEIAPKATIEA